jgi:hypothetical protein
VTSGENLPNIIKDKIRKILFRDPYANSIEILQELMTDNDQTTDQSQMSITVWFLSYVLGKGNEQMNELLEYIQFQSTAAITSKEIRENTSLISYQVFHGPSIQSVQYFCHTNSYTKYLQPIGHDHEFHSFHEFVSYYRFPSSESVLCIPVSENDFHGTTFNQEQVENASSCIIFTSPVHLWALHQLLTSPTHKALSVFSMDGVFSLRLLRAGAHKSVIMSLGFIDLNVHDNSRPLVVTRAFVPCLHCLSPKENAPTAFLCLKGLSRIYQNFFSQPVDIHCLSADASQAIASGLSQSFP